MSRVHEMIKKAAERGKQKTAGMANSGEEVEQMIWKRRTRAQTRGEAQGLFSTSGDTIEQDRADLKKLFVQTDGAELGAGLMDLPADLKKVSHVASFLDMVEKKAGLTEAQRRYPELQKVSEYTSGGAERTTKTQPPKKRDPKAAFGPGPATAPMTGGRI